MGSEKSEHYPMQHLTAHTHSLGRRAKPTKARRKVSASLRLPRQGTQQGARWGNTEAGMTSLRSSPTFMPLTPCSTAMSKRRSAKRRVRNNFGLTPTAKGKGDAPTARETFEQADWLLSSEKESRRRCKVQRAGRGGRTHQIPALDNVARAQREADVARIEDLAVGKLARVLHLDIVAGLQFMQASSQQDTS
jgi:hypothetical protein